MANMHVFNIAARTLSFTLAAQELNMSQSAVSHRMKKLEQQLGFKLFIRKTRQLALTPEGERLKITVSLSFDNIYTELNDITHDELSGELYIGTSNGFASYWLMPRLARFQQRYPNLDIRLQAQNNAYDFDYEPIDVAIYYLESPPTNLHYEKILNEQRMPLCTAEYAQQLNLEQHGIEGLRNATFIHRSQSQAWQQWLDIIGSDINPNLKKYSFNHSDLYMKAALNSLGIVMGRYQFAQKALAEKTLINPLPAIDATASYYLVCRKNTDQRPKYKAFRQWLLNEINNDI
ncbi:LysR substrate-binding domain-containing protein [Photobacterium kishitanii]|nr:LysR substrate-binding domain-containing protein [Photobacterium kishitanii]